MHIITRSFSGYTKQSWHQILGVSPLATLAEIKQAHRALVLKNHPDVALKINHDAKSIHANFQRIQEAYEEALRQQLLIAPKAAETFAKQQQQPSTKSGHAEYQSSGQNAYEEILRRMMTPKAAEKFAKQQQQPFTKSGHAKYQGSGNGMFFSKFAIGAAFGCTVASIASGLYEGIQQYNNDKQVEQQRILAKTKTIAPEVKAAETTSFTNTKIAVAATTIIGIGAVALSNYRPR